MERPDKTILLDANLLVLLVVGTASRQLIAKHKKTRTFTVADYDRLVAVLGDCRVVVLPPSPRRHPTSSLVTKSRKEGGSWLS